MVNGPKNSVSITLRGKEIQDVSSYYKSDLNGVNGGGALVFPGLVNSHDHLRLNLYPLIKSRLYKNYKEWAEDVQNNYPSILKPYQSIPSQLLYNWGILKNLVNGVTTVVQHGPELLNPLQSYIDVLVPHQNLHSVAFEKGWRYKLWRSLRAPIIMHIGEGVDVSIQSEFERVVKSNIWNRPIIPIHGLGIDRTQLKKCKALIWCPQSNVELYGTTLSSTYFKEPIPFLFGMDSTLSASWNLWEHLRTARERVDIPAVQLFNMLTKLPTSVWGLGLGNQIKEGYQANLVVAKNEQKHLNRWEAFYSLDPQDILLVVKNGKLALIDEEWWPLFNGTSMVEETYFPCQVGQKVKWLPCDVENLRDQIRSFYPKMVFQFGV